MKDYLEKRREELRKREDGFTLMEMLIVVAIIAVLIAIAIPVFSAQLENSREATDAANLRNAYAEVSAEFLSSNKSGDDNKKEVASTQTQENWTNESIKKSSIGDIKVSTIKAQTGGAVWTVTCDSSGKVAITPAAS